MTDLVNHPAHYTSGPAHTVCGQPIECIDITETLGFNLGNAIKYIWRADLKGSRVQDLEKARWYITREIERLSRNAAQPPETAPVADLGAGLAPTDTQPAQEAQIDVRRLALDLACPEPPCRREHWQRVAEEVLEADL